MGSKLGFLWTVRLRVRVSLSESKGNELGESPRNVRNVLPLSTCPGMGDNLLEIPLFIEMGVAALLLAVREEKMVFYEICG